MKNALLFLSLFTASITSAQQVIMQQPCNSPSIQLQADSVQAKFEKEGFLLLRSASVTMQSEYEMPVIVPMQQHRLYQFVFIGEEDAKLYEVRMYDWDEKMVAYHKKMWGDVDGNIISFQYIPKFTEQHMFKPVQVHKKKKTLCGYVMLFKHMGSTKKADG